MNEMAHELKVETTLSFLHTDIFVKAPFNKNMLHSFNQFDADEKLESAPEPLELNEMEKGNIDKMDKT